MSASTHQALVQDQWLHRSLIDVRLVVRELSGVFGAPTVAELAGQRDRKIAYRWALADGPSPRPEAQRRLYAFYRSWLTVADQTDHQRTLAWFTSGHPALGEQSPLDVFRAGDLPSATSASDKFRSAVTSGGPLIGPIRTAHWHFATLLPPRELIQECVDFFGARTTAGLAGESDRKAAYRWMKADGPTPSFAVRRRLSVVHRVRVAISSATSPVLAKHWFVAASPALNEQMPLTAALQSDLPALVLAADEFLGVAERSVTRRLNAEPVDRPQHLSRTA